MSLVRAISFSRFHDLVSVPCSCTSSKQVLEDANIPFERVRICYSPFARTAHTARVVASVLGLPFEGDQCKVISFVVGDDIKTRQAKF